MTVNDWLATQIKGYHSKIVFLIFAELPFKQ